MTRNIFIARLEKAGDIVFGCVRVSIYLYIYLSIYVCICLLARYLKNGSSDFDLLLHTNYILVYLKMINFWTQSDSRWPPQRADSIKHKNGPNSVNF